MPYYRRRNKYGGLPRLKLKVKKKTLQAISGLFFIFAGGVSLLSFFGPSGLAKQLADQINLYAGVATPLVPFVFALTGILLLRVRIPFMSANLVAGAYLFSLSLASLFGVFSENMGGKIGYFLGQTASSVLFPIGAVFTFVILLLVSVVVFFNTSLEGFTGVSGLAFVSTFNFLKKLFTRKEKEAEPEFMTKGLTQRPTPEPREEEEEVFTQRKEPITNLSGTQVWEYPSLELLTESIGAQAQRGDIKQNAAIIEKTLESFGIQAKVIEVNMGPAVTQYALEIALGTKLTKITSLANDIALALAAPTGTVRIEAPIPGKSLVGIELPNITPEIVPLKKILASTQMQKNKSKLAMTLGLDVSGQPIISNLDRMPHILMAGSTGSGKSVGLNAFISSILFRATPNDVKFIMVDPKRVELSNWNGIPHLLTEVITEPEKVLSALKWAVSEMEKRYKLFADVKARNIDMYNEISGFQALPYIVLIIDELADIMLFAPVEVEDAITRLAQMSRAVGIHMILATQRPSVDVLTGLIKANIPCRIAFNVASQVDSRVIIDQVGAEKLLGRGDMLYVPPDASKPQRIQGVYVSEPEIMKLIEFLKKSGVEPQYTEEITTMPVATKLAGKTGDQDELFEEAVKVIVQHDRASASLLQRRLRIGYARAARLLDELEAAGVVGVADGSKARDVLVRDAERVLGGGQEGSG
jgi:S-DNA-T family DNA segregation ATPase FtsK/SpoIIIE